MEQRRLIILAALGLEARAIADQFGMRLPAGGGWSSSTIHDRPVELHLIGMRALRLPPDLSRDDLGCIVMAGVAGGLDPALKVGDVIIDRTPDNFCPGVPLKPGRIYTTDRIVTTPAQKAELFRQTGCVAVEMEHAIVQEAIEPLGVPFVGIRAISDAADESLDPAVIALADEMGHPKARAVVSCLLRNPGMVPTLLRLGNAAKTASRELGKAVRTFVDSWAGVRTPDSQNAA